MANKRSKKPKGKKGPTKKRPVMIKCLACGQSEEYPHYGKCPKCGHLYAVYA